jgi:ABC-type transporter Mla subunit MlaD
MDLLGEVATELKAEVVQTLALSRALIEQSTARIAEADAVIELAEGVFEATTPKIEDALSLLATSLERTDQILAEISPRVGPMQDSLMATLSHARLILSSFDTLAMTAHGLLNENRSVVLEALERLNHTTLLLDYFAEQITRRPTRLLTGVTLPPLDTTEMRR